MLFFFLGNIRWFYFWWYAQNTLWYASKKYMTFDSYRMRLFFFLIPSYITFLTFWLCFGKSRKLQNICVTFLNIPSHCTHTNDKKKEKRNRNIHNTCFVDYTNSHILLCLTRKSCIQTISHNREEEKKNYHIISFYFFTIWIGKLFFDSSPFGF